MKSLDRRLQGNKEGKVSPMYRELHAHITGGSSYGEVKIAFPRIQELFNKLNDSEKERYRQLLIERKRTLTALLKSGNAKDEDRRHCESGIKMVNFLAPQLGIDLEEPTQ